MNKLFLIIGIVFLFTFNANAVMLASDPPQADEQVSSGQVEFDGSWESPFLVPGCTDKQVGCIWTDGDNVQHFIWRDLEGVGDGQHTVRARFINEWGDGEISDPFVFNKNRPGKQQIRLIP